MFRIEQGIKILFIPYSEGVYVPFILHQYSNEESENVFKTGIFPTKAVHENNEKSIKNNFFLDLEALDDNSQKILK